ncbi:RING/U-box superfamily protein [Striga asiatica]|uniref:RING/U-box superfamily protein n=1 Tax=Striga asiatica TaxID=4170 RepID=A0A5A7PC30_STRAF|nr:RING/U-box superfamily protein [Striga asiatica]
MASMVAKACSNTSSQMPVMTVQEKGSRNKRKFRADPPLADPTKPIPLPSSDCTSFEFSAVKFDTHGHSNACDLCCLSQDTPDSLKLDLGLSCAVGPSNPTHHRDEIDTLGDDFHDADWSDLTETELEELVLCNLDTIFKSAIKKIVASGYSEDVATKAILRSGLWYGCKDTVSNVVDNTLAFLRSGQEIDPSKENCFEDLQQMKKYILAELVCLLREVRPFFSTGDAMWCLLICDMNVSHACAMDSDPFCSFLGDVPSNSTSSLLPAQSQSRMETKNPEHNNILPCKLNCPPESIQGGHSSQPQAKKVSSASNVKHKAHPVANGLVLDKDCQNPNPDTSEKPPFNTVGISEIEDKFVGGKKLSVISKREYILRQKSMHFEKHYRTYGSSKGTSRASKLSAFSSLVLDKKLKGVADPSNINAKNSPTFSLDKAAAQIPSLPVADTELSLSFPAKGIANPMPISYSVEPTASGRPLRWAPQDKKDEMIMKLVPRARELQNQLQEWTEWANQKVMQAARRLGKDKAELKALRQEKEEVEQLKKEKQTLEESTMKKLLEMENALCKASGQVERANAAVRRLEVENLALRQEMEVARRREAESAASCREVSRREKKTLVKFQSWEKQKAALQEELAGERLRIARIRERLQQAKDAQDLVEAKLHEEQKAKDELLTQASSFKKEREQIEVSTQSKEDTVKSRAQTNLQKYKDDIEGLEREISKLRLKTDSSKIAALRRGIDASYASKLTSLKNMPLHKGLTTVSHTTILKDLTANGGVKRERECVMCLSEEMSVVFLPCAHQVVCTMCNELHEKQGMKDCPSCRSPIQRRVCVRYARP